MGGEFGNRGGRPRLGETKEEAYERRRALWDTAAQEPNPKTAPEPPINPKNPLNDNVNANVNENEKENVYDNINTDVKGNEKGNVDINEKKDGNEYVNAGGGFVDSLILNDFDDEEEDCSYGEGSMSAYIHSKYLEEEERNYRYSQSLEEDKELYI